MQRLLSHHNRPLYATTCIKDVELRRGYWIFNEHHPLIHPRDGREPQYKIMKQSVEVSGLYIPIHYN